MLSLAIAQQVDLNNSEMKFADARIIIHHVGLRFNKYPPEQNVNEALAAPLHFFPVK